MTDAVMDLSVIKGRQQQIWSKGDYGMIARPMVIMGELLCESVDLRAGQKVLDVATGSGNAALSAARRGCDVAGIDYVPFLLDYARERAHAERLAITFQEGDAENIPFPDESFDVVLSTIGAMFAPDQERTARELLRVCRSGGKIGLTNWTPDGFVGQWFRVTARYIPPPPGVRPPALWGTEERLRELFGKHTTQLEVIRRSFVFRYRTAQDWLDYFKTYFGPFKGAFDTLDAAAQENLAQDMLALVQQFNRSGDETVVAPSDYLEMVAVKL